MVTSSAVVGSSAISILGPTRYRHRDHDTLAHAARQLMGKLVDTVFGRRDADALEKIDGQRAGLARRQPLVQPYRLGDLVADGEHWIKRCHRFLKNHGNPLAANLTHRVERL